MHRTFIIAEAGVNHNGVLDNAMKLIDVAVDAHVDAVKFQTFKADKIAVSTVPKAQYQIINTGIQESQHEMLKRLEFTRDMHKELISYCKKKDIIFMSTPFDEDSADMLDELGLSIFKIPSGEITNKPLIQHIAQKGKPIILSTGMSYIGEVEQAVQWINTIWDNIKNIPQMILLHCVSDYPSLVEDTNLLAIKTMEMAFGLPVGYSDHSTGIEIAIAAVAIGAKVIEKHLTLDRDMQGPDHKASLEPNELKAMVQAIRNVEKALGSGVKKPSHSELNNIPIVRKSIVASENIACGEIFTNKNITIKRPGIGISPQYWDRLIGSKAVRDFSKDEIIEV